MKFLKDKKRVIKSYSFISILANFLIALSISGLSVLGVISSEIALPVVITLAVVFGLFGLVGRFIDQTEEDKNAD